MVTNGSLLCWKYRGAGSNEFELELKQLMRGYRPRVIILSEPQIDGETIERVCKRLGKKHWARSEALGFSWGVWVLWDEEEVGMKLMVARRSFLHMEVQIRDEENWMMTAVYASPQPGIRKFIWDQLDSLKLDRPWMLIGDFNCVQNDEEREKLEYRVLNYV